MTAQFNFKPANIKPFEFQSMTPVHVRPTSQEAPDGGEWWSDEDAPTGESGDESVGTVLIYQPTVVLVSTRWEPHRVVRFRSESAAKSFVSELTDYSRAKSLSHYEEAARLNTRRRAALAKGEGRTTAQR